MYQFSNGVIIPDYSVSHEEEEGRFVYMFVTLISKTALDSDFNVGSYIHVLTLTPKLICFIKL
jgi:hypothetical protein